MSSKIVSAGSAGTALQGAPDVSQAAVPEELATVQTTPSLIDESRLLSCTANRLFGVAQN